MSLLERKVEEHEANIDTNVPRDFIDKVTKNMNCFAIFKIEHNKKKPLKTMTFMGFYGHGYTIFKNNFVVFC